MVDHSLFSVTPTPPTAVRLEHGKEGMFSFTLTSLKAPDQVQDVLLQALLLDADDKGTEVDWLVAGPSRSLRMAGGKTETVTITVRPGASTPKGEHRIRLAIADREHPNDTFVYSAPVTCDVVDEPRLVPPTKKSFPSWMILAIVGGILLLGGGAFAIWKLTSSSAPEGPSTPSTPGAPSTRSAPSTSWAPSSATKCDDKAGSKCGTCGGLVQCDGRCSKKDPDGVGDACGQCGGRLQCDGKCSPKDPDNYGEACGECGGVIECDGKCSKPLRRCSAGSVEDKVEKAKVGRSRK